MEQGELIDKQKARPLLQKSPNADLQHSLLVLSQQYACVAEDVLGDNLISVVLFGSVARSEARLNSDINLLIVCRQLPQGAFQRQALLEPVRQQLQAELEPLWQQRCYVDFTELLKDETEAQQQRLLYLDMTEDAVFLFDRDNFFADVLARLRKRLSELGSQRKQLGNIRYWDLKPDFEPGEQIVL